MSRYDEYDYLDVSVEEGVAVVEIGNPGYTMRGHYEVNTIWRDLDADKEVRSVILTWADPPKEPLGAHYPPEMGPEAAAEDPAKWWSRWHWPFKEAREGIRDLLDCRKLVVSTLRGDVPYGASLVLATLADVSIAAEDCVIADRHIDAAMAAGDGAVHWSLLCGVQQAKYLALTSAEITGAEAERIGLVSLCFPDERVLPEARRLARKFADGPQHAQHYTKRTFNQMLRFTSMMGMEMGLAYEALNIVGDPDVAVAAEWHKAEQGEPRGYDIEERPPMPSVANPYGPGELRP
jgi:enoyl-CoA hydratase